MGFNEGPMRILNPEIRALNPESEGAGLAAHDPRRKPCLEAAGERKVYQGSSLGFTLPKP